MSVMGRVIAGTAGGLGFMIVASFFVGLIARPGQEPPPLPTMAAFYLLPFLLALFAPNARRAWGRVCLLVAAALCAGPVLAVLAGPLPASPTPTFARSVGTTSIALALALAAVAASLAFGRRRRPSPMRTA